MSTVARNRRRRKRGVTRRVRDEKGNIIVKRYAKKQSRFRIPGLKWSHAPQLAVGLPLLFHSLGTYLYKEGRLQPGDLFYDWFDSFNLYTGLTRLLVTGTLGFLIPLLIGYPIVTKGFKIRYWSTAWRQLVVIWAISLIFLAIFSPFINEFGVIRQQSDDEFVINDNNYDLSNLDSPFYAELLNGILDLLGNIPNPEEEVAYIYPRDGGTLDPDSDRFLYRWRVAETYSEELADFEQGFPNFRNDLIDFSEKFEEFEGNLSNARHLEIAEQYLTISTEYSGEALTPWNSEYGSPVGSTTNLAIETLEESEATIVAGTGSGYIDINEQPFLSAQISEPRTQGYLSYDAYFIQDDKQAIKNEAVLLSELEAKLLDFFSAANANQRFNGLSSEGSFDSIWGETSLPGGSSYKTGNTNFNDKYNEFDQTINENTTVFDLILGVSNEIQSAILSAIADDSLPIDGTGEGTGVAPEGTDKAYWFFDSLASDGNQAFGIEEAIAGFVNMLRAFKIPARPVLGFSVGDFQNSDGTSCSSNCDQILVQFEHIHVWIEALIPRINSTGDLIFSWGIFNPIPDPHILSQDSTDFEFGRNALGGAPDIELEITSGIATNFTATFDFGPFGERSGVLQNQVGSDVEGRVRVLYDGVPSSGQNINLKLINESDIFDNDVTVDIGVDLGSVVTSTNPDGWSDFAFHVATNGSVYGYDGTLLFDASTSVGLMDPLGSPGSLGVYAIVGTYGLSFGGDVTGFSLNATFTLGSDAPQETLINPNTLELEQMHGILKNTVVNFTISVTEPGGPLGIEGVEGIQLLMLDETQASNLIIELLANIWDDSFITSNSLGTFTTTDTNGDGWLEVDYATESFATSEVYVLVAVLQQGSLYDEAFAWYSEDLDLTSILKYNNGTEEDVVDDLLFENGVNPTADFLINTTAIGLQSGVDPQFSAAPAEGVQLSYYILEETIYTGFVNGNPGNVAYALLEGSNYFGAACSTTVANFISSGCYDVTNGGSSSIVFTGGTSTDASGFAQVVIHLENTGFAESYFYIIVVAHDFSTLAETVRFFSASPPALGLFNLNEPTTQLSPEDTGSVLNEVKLNNIIIGNESLMKPKNLSLIIDKYHQDRLIAYGGRLN